MKKSVSPLHASTKESKSTNAIAYKPKQRESQPEFTVNKLQKNLPSYREIKESKTMYMLKKKQSEVTPTKDNNNSNKENIKKPLKERSVSPNAGPPVSSSCIIEKGSKKVQNPEIKRSSNIIKTTEPNYETAQVTTQPAIDDLKQDGANNGLTPASINKSIVKRFEAFLGQLHEEKKKFYKKISDRRSKYSLVQESREDLSSSRFPYEEIEESNNMQKLMELPVDELLKTLRTTKALELGENANPQILPSTNYISSLNNNCEAIVNASSSGDSGSSSASLLDECVDKKKIKFRGSFGENQRNNSTMNASDLREFIKTEREVNLIEQMASNEDTKLTLFERRMESPKRSTNEIGFLKSYGTLQNPKIEKIANPFMSAPGALNVTVLELRKKAQDLQKTVCNLDFQIAKVNSETIIVEREINEYLESQKEIRLQREEEERIEMEKIEKECNNLEAIIKKNRKELESEKKWTATLKKKVTDNKEFITSSEDLKKFLNMNSEKVTQQYEKQTAEKLKLLEELKESSSISKAKLQATNEHFKEIKVLDSPERLAFREEYKRASLLPKECLEMENFLKQSEEEQERIFLDLHTDLTVIQEEINELNELKELRESEWNKKGSFLAKEKIVIMEQDQYEDLKPLEEELCESEIELARLETELIEKGNMDDEAFRRSMEEKNDHHLKNIERCSIRISLLQPEVNNLKESKAVLTKDSQGCLNKLKAKKESLISQNQSLKINLEEVRENRKGLEYNCERIDELEKEIDREILEKQLESNRLRQESKLMDNAIKELISHKGSILTRYKELNFENSEGQKSLEKMDTVIEEYMSESLEIKSENKTFHLKRMKLQADINSYQQDLTDQNIMLESLKVGLEKQYNQINSLNHEENERKLKLRRLETVSTVD